MTVREATPVLGPLAKAAARLPVGGRKRQRLITLIAAYADAGQPSPSVRELARRLGMAGTQADVRTLDALLRRLEQGGFLEVRRQRGQRNAYRILVGGGE